MPSFIELTCCTCGIDFGFSKKIEELWKTESVKKTFYCPNGHPLAYAPRDEISELKKAKVRITELESELVAAKKTIEELKLQIETWKPTTESK